MKNDVEHAVSWLKENCNFENADKQLDFIRAISSVEEALKDNDRMTWLEDQEVHVNTPLVYGSRPNFVAYLNGCEEDPLPSYLRCYIDKAMENKT